MRRSVESQNMPRGIFRTITLLCLVILASLGVWEYYDRFSTYNQIRKLQEQTRQLEAIVSRLTSEKRVAELLVTDQKKVGDVLHTTVLFVEYGRNGDALPPRQFELIGGTAHLDAMVIKFDHDFVKQGDPLKGHSIALFTKIYGDHQTPAQAAQIDEAGQAPEVYRGSDPKLSEFEHELWMNFWKLADDENFRKAHGVRVAMGQGAWAPFEPNKLYTITLEAAGGLSMTSEPLKGIYREALKRRAAI